MMELQALWHPSQADFDLFARVSGDDNPIHVDPAFSARTAFGRTVSHGMLIYAKLWGLICTERAGARAVRQSMMFPNPTFAGDEIRLSVRGELPGHVEMRAVRVSDGADVFLGDAEVA